MITCGSVDEELLGVLSIFRIGRECTFVTMTIIATAIEHRRAKGDMLLDTN